MKTIERKQPLIIPGKFSRYKKYIKNQFGSDLVAYWAMNEFGGSQITDYSGNDRHGVYTGVTLGALKAPGGTYAPYFDGANDYGNIASSGIDGNINLDEGSAFIWYRPFDLATITDGTDDFLFQLAEGTGFISLRKYISAPYVRFYRKNDDLALRLVQASMTTAIWHFVVVTWSVSGNENNMYFDNVLQTPVAGITTIAGSINNLTTNIGASSRTGPTAPQNGYLAHLGLVNRIVSSAEAEQLYTRGL